MRVSEKQATPRAARDPKKCVRWSTVTVYEFDVGIGGSAIPRHGGPSVGLAKTPTLVWSKSLAHATADSECDDLCGEGHTTDRSEYVGGTDSEREQDCRQARAIVKIHERQQRRRHRVRWLKPFERVTMLTQAGLSEKRIYRMMKECAAICMSRRLSIQSTPP